MAKILTEEEQLILRNKAKAELERLETELSDLETKKMIDNYKEKFSLCEDELDEVQRMIDRIRKGGSQ